MPNDTDVKDHGSIFNHDAVVRFARSGGTSALSAPLTVSSDAASSRLLGRILAAVSRLDEFASPEPGLSEISSLLDDIPGISGAVFEMGTVVDFSADSFNKIALDYETGTAILTRKAGGRVKEVITRLAPPSLRRLNGFERARFSQSDQAPAIALLAPTQMGHVTSHLGRR